MTPQEIFDTVATHLFAQGQRAFVHESEVDDVNDAGCRYRMADGKRCAVGCIMPDENYRPEFEGQSALDLIDGYWRELPEYFCQNSMLLGDLQGVHDDLYNWSSSSCLEFMLRGVANDHGLSVDVLKNLSL